MTYDMPDPIDAAAIADDTLLDDLIFAAKWVEGAMSAKQTRAWEKRTELLKTEILRRMKK